MNGLYGGGSGQQRFKSKAYKAWLKSCPNLILAECGMISFPVKVRYTYYMPDKRARDLGNLEKAVSDYLVSQCVIEDDNIKIIQEISIKYGGIDRDNPRVKVEIYDTKT